ncbi:MAG: triose-phosphate isomerase [Brevundimonas sp.]|nr:MAG: triose-phosphate isomerase [Brevundimonas sp.]
MKQSVKLIVGNWKMNGAAGGLEQARLLAKALNNQPTANQVVLCPPATLLERIGSAVAGSPIQIGAQDCRAEPSGAFTGCVSAELASEAGASFVILGHSERRAGFSESDDLVAAKARAALAAGLTPIICVGETLEQRDAGQAADIVERQVRASVPDEAAASPFAVSYEPVWAIGTGRTPTLAQIAEIHAVVRRVLAERFGSAGETVPILYGGSVNPKNAADILHVEGVGGALVGGASLKADDFLAIIRAA